jgi:predicted 2-oxoglutarate/Fe(II)-dependent dioxygenase YbiX
MSAVLHELPAALGPAPLHPLPPGLGHCVLVPGFLSRDECRRLIGEAQARGFANADTDYPPSYRNNDRQVRDDPTLARALLPRLRPHVPATLAADAGHWALEGINPRLRLCRYRPGQAFHLHQDGVHHPGGGLRSHLTFMVYLTDGDEFEGGDTLFYDRGPGARPPRVVARVRPRAGSLIVFDHRVWHAGEVVTAGVKHIMRSDVMYRCTQPAASGTTRPAHHGYVWTLERLPGDALQDRLALPGEGAWPDPAATPATTPATTPAAGDAGRPHSLVASGGRDTVIRVWDAAGRCRRELRGHTQSVLGLAALGGPWLASVSRDRSLRVWDVAAGRCVHVDARHPAALLSVAACGPAGRGQLATGSADGLVRVSRVPMGPASPGNAEPMLLAGHRSWVWAVQALGEARLASASEDGDVRLWDLALGTCTACLPGRTPLRTLAVAPDGQRLAAAGIDGCVALWHLQCGHWRHQASWTAHAAAVRRVRFFDAATLASAGEDGQVHLWRLEDGREARRLDSTRHDNFATDMLPLPTALPGPAWLSCSYDGSLRRRADGTDQAVCEMPHGDPAPQRD